MSNASSAFLPTALLGKLARSMFRVVLDRLNEIDTRMTIMTQATDKLAANVNDLTAAVGEALTQIESEIATIKAVPSAPASTVTPEDTAAINTSADNISQLTATIRSALLKAQSELAAPASGSDTVTGGGSDTITGASGNSTIVDGAAPVSSAPASAPTFGDSPAGGA